MALAFGGLRHDNVRMSTHSPDIFGAALNLPDAERADLAYRLLQSLKPPGGISDGEAGFDRELERRVTEYDAGRTNASNWDEVAKRLQTTIQQRTRS